MSSASRQTDILNSPTRIFILNWYTVLELWKKVYPTGLVGGPDNSNCFYKWLAPSTIIVWHCINIALNEFSFHWEFSFFTCSQLEDNKICGKYKLFLICNVIDQLTLLSDNSSLQTFSEWCNYTKLSLSIAKTKYILFSPIRVTIMPILRGSCHHFL